MKIKYDEKYDTMYIELIPGNYECRTIRLSEEISLNIGPGEILIGIEILDASEIIGNGAFPTVTLENLKLETG